MFNLILHAKSKAWIFADGSCGSNTVHYNYLSCFVKFRKLLWIRDLYSKLTWQRTDFVNTRTLDLPSKASLISVSELPGPKTTALTPLSFRLDTWSFFKEIKGKIRRQTVSTTSLSPCRKTSNILFRLPCWVACEKSRCKTSHEDLPSEQTLRLYLPTNEHMWPLGFKKGTPECRKNPEIPNTRTDSCSVSGKLKADLHGTTLSHATSLRQACDSLRTIYARTTFSLTKLNMQKFAPGFTERKF